MGAPTFLSDGDIAEVQRHYRAFDQPTPRYTPVAKTAAGQLGVSRLILAQAHQCPCFSCPVRSSCATECDRFRRYVDKES